MVKGTGMKLFGLSVGIASMMMMVSGDNQVDAKGCSKSCKKRFLDGNCDEECNVLECFFDGGDCFKTGGYYDGDYDGNYDGYYDVEDTPAPTEKPTKKRSTNFPTTLSTKFPTTLSTKFPTTRSTKAPTVAVSSAPTTSDGVDKTKYNIEIVYVGSMDASIKQSFVKAKAKWETIIKNDIPNTYTYKKGTKCWENFTKLPQDKVVDDLMIFAQVDYIDGPGRILGAAGPCYVTESPQKYSRVGLMQFDSADLQDMVNDGSIDAVILHEMGHVIGIGTLWEDYNLIQFPTRTQKNAFYLGAGGIEGLKQIQGSGKPLVETDGGQGTAYGHWDEVAYENELMTGYAGGDEKFSLLTIQSLKDMGFVVDASQADEFTVPSNKPKLRGEEAEKKAPKRPLGDDVIHKPISIGEADPY